MSDVKPTILEVVDKLATLGSPDQIALHFEQQGIVGFRGEESACPVACYVFQETGLPVHASSVGVTGVTPCEPGERVRFRSGGAKIEKYEPITQFIRNFDRQHYPILDADTPKVSDPSSRLTP